VSTLIKEIKKVNYKLLLDVLTRKFKSAYEVFEAEGVLLKVDNTVPSLINVVIAVRSIGRSNCYVIHFSTRHSNLKNIHRLHTYGKFNFSQVDINHIYRYLKRNIPDLGYKSLKREPMIDDDIKALFMRHYARKYNFIVSGDIDKSEWITGSFSKYYAGCSDILPLTGIYKTQLKSLSRALRVSHLMKNTEEPRHWSMFKNSFKRVAITDEKIDAILYGLEKDWSISDIADDIQISKSVVKTIRDNVEKSYYFRNSPITF